MGSDKKPTSTSSFRDALRKFAYDGDTLRDLNSLDTRATPGFEKKSKKKKQHKKAKTLGKERGIEFRLDQEPRLTQAQELLFANAQTAGLEKSVLLVLQGMDTSGKGSTVKHVVGSMNPQGVHQVGFKAPTEEELEHDFLWRIRKHIPAHGMLGVFDRSHYEDVLIHRVEGLTAPSQVERRYGTIRQFEKDLVADGVVVVKVMLLISREEQYERLMARLDEPEKHWKYDPSDLRAREKWDEYLQAYQVAIEETDKPEAPWYVIPADRKWYARLAVQQILAETIEDLALEFPKAHFDVEEQRAKLKASR